MKLKRKKKQQTADIRIPVGSCACNAEAYVILLFTLKPDFISNGQGKEKSAFRSVYIEIQAIQIKAVAGKEAWFYPFGYDNAIPGLWQR